jgi:hypothetical protein
MAFRLVLLVALAAVGTVLAAVAPGSSPDGVAAPSPPADEETDPPIADCEATLGKVVREDPTIDSHARKVSLLAGPMLFLGAKQWRKEPRKLFKPNRRGGLRGAKVPIYLEADREVQVTVLPPEGHRALFDVGLQQPPYHARGASVIVRSCPGEEVPGRPFGPWTWMPAGFKVDAPMCLGIEVTVAGAHEPITKSIALGRRTRRTCPGR